VRSLLSTCIVLLTLKYCNLQINNIIIVLVSIVFPPAAVAAKFGTEAGVIWAGVIILGACYGLGTIVTAIVNGILGLFGIDLHIITPHEVFLAIRARLGQFPSSPFRDVAMGVWTMIELVADIEGTIARAIVYGPQSYDWQTMEWDMSRSFLWRMRFGDHGKPFVWHRLNGYGIL
jgi:hypothetical protein